MNKTFAARLTTAEPAELLGVTTARVRQLTNEGYIKRGADGRIKLIKAVQGHHRMLTEKRSERTSADAAFKRMRMRKLELEMAQQIRELIPLQDALDTESELLAMMMADLDGMPAAFTRDLDLRQQIAEYINMLRAKWEQACTSWAADLRSGAPPDDQDEEEAA
jgi:hypothetical protein